MLPIALLGICFLISPAWTTDCSSPPIYVDLRARSVQGTGSLSYGAFISLGSPAQPLSLWPSLSLDEITVADLSYCSETQCSASAAHGTFDETMSTSWKLVPSTSSENTTTLTGNSASTVAASGSDTLRLYESFFADDASASQVNLTSFPIELLTNYTATTTPFFGPAGLVGLGPGGTLLDQLFKQGKIASRSFGLYLGSAFNVSSTTLGGSPNGSLTLGGYDGARFYGVVSGFQIVHPSGPLAFEVPVSNIRMQNATDTVKELMANQAPFSAHLNTSQYMTTLPSSLESTFQLAAIGGKDLTTVDFELNYSLNISVNASIALPAIQFSSEGPYILGASFLTSAYLTVNYDHTPPMFFLAQASPSPAFVSTQSLCPERDRPSPSADPHLSFFVKNGLIGLIIGGSILGIALSVTAFVLLRHRYRAVKERTRIVRFGDMKKGPRDDERYRGEDMEMNDYMQPTPSRDVPNIKSSQFSFPKEKEKNFSVSNRETMPSMSGGGGGRDDNIIYFDPPPTPRRGPFSPKGNANKKLRLKSILKVRTQGIQ